MQDFMKLWPLTALFFFARGIDLRFCSWTACERGSKLQNKPTAKQQECEIFQEVKPVSVGRCRFGFERWRPELVFLSPVIESVLLRFNAWPFLFWISLFVVDAMIFFFWFKLLLAVTSLLLKQHFTQSFYMLCIINVYLMQ